ncbi:MAG: acyltransferase [Euryarchaeota archaeon]|nr:acyltransferase [Euryarchaeota archaeon]
MRRVEVFPSEGSNSLVRWYRIRNPLRVALNFLVIYTCRFLPSLALKRVLLRLIGMKVGRNVSIGLGATFDIFFPELIEIGDNSVIGYNAAILAHEFLVKEWRRGRVRLGKNVMLGARSLVLPGVEIGDNATVAAYSLVNRDIPPGAFAAGVPARVRGGEK